MPYTPYLLPYTLRPLSLLALIPLLLSCTSPHTKVACVGDSITQGTKKFWRLSNNYPNQLEELLGGDYEVKNFGKSGATLLKKGNQPYWEESEYQDALAYDADWIFIMLGTNDSKAVNRPYYEDFQKDYRELIASFQQSEKTPKIFLMLPPPSFAQNPNQIWDPVIKEQIIPITREVAEAEGLPLVDLYQAFLDKSHLLPDGVHPSPEGRQVMAEKVFETIQAFEQ